MEQATIGQRFASLIVDAICRWFLIGIIIDLFAFQKGTTIGRRQAGIIVIDSEGNPASFGLMWVRSIIKGLFGMISIILVIFGQDSVHDLILKTKVVKA